MKGLGVLRSVLKNKTSETGENEECFSSWPRQFCDSFDHNEFEITGLKRKSPARGGSVSPNAPR